MSLVLEFLSTFILTIVQIYAWYKISGKKFSLNFFNLFITLILSVYSLINFNLINVFFKPALLLFAAIVSCKLLLKEKIINCIIIVFCQYLLVIVYDAVLTLILLLLFSDNIDVVFSNFSGSLIVDFIMCILVIVSVNIKIPRKLYYFILKRTYNLKSKQVAIFLLMVILCSVNIFALTYYNDNILIAMIVNIIITFIYVFIVIGIIHTKNKYITISNRYYTSLEDLKAQESIINDYRILNHENKNNLMTIKMMSKNKKVEIFINSLLNQKEKLMNKMIDEISKLPEGGIRALIYNKLINMKEREIRYLLEVDKSIDYKLFSKIEDYDVVDICQVLGVFIDNAIEESEKNDNKNKNIITISLHLSNNTLEIAVMNYYNHSISNNLKSTKGIGRGYGLKLVNKIIEENHNLSNIREISKNLFVQKLLVKIK